jgi:hypothetical protein
MKKLTTNVGVFGPFESIETLEDRYHCDDSDFHFTVVGAGTISDVEEGDFPPPVPPAKTPEEVQLDVVTKTQARLDDFAATRNYAGILSLCTYSVSLIPKFAAEGQYGVQLRDDTWSTCYAILAEVEAGTRPLPSGYAEIASELPTPQWPA